MKILNSLSLNMYKGNEIFPLTEEISLEQAQDMVWTIIPGDGPEDRLSVTSASFYERHGDVTTINWCGESCIGHADIARIIKELLSLKNHTADISQNRKTVKFEAGNTCLIAQYLGERLPEGTTQLPKGAKIVFFKCCFVKREEFEERKKCSNVCRQLSYDEAGWGMGLSQVIEKVFKKFFPEHWREHSYD